MPRTSKTSKPSAPDLSALPAGSPQLLEALIAGHAATPHATRKHATHPATERSKTRVAGIKRLLVHETLNGRPVACDFCRRTLSWSAAQTDPDDVRIIDRQRILQAAVAADYLVTCPDHEWLPRAAEALGCPLTAELWPGATTRQGTAHPDGYFPKGEELRTGPRREYPLGVGDTSDGRPDGLREGDRPEPADRLHLAVTAVRPHVARILDGVPSAAAAARLRVALIVAAAQIPD